MDVGYAPSQTDLDLEILGRHIKSAPSTTGTTEDVFKHFSRSMGTLEEVSLLWSSSNRQLLSYLADEVIDGFFLFLR